MDSYLIVNLNSAPKRLDIFSVDANKVSHIEGCDIEEPTVQLSETVGSDTAESAAEVSIENQESDQDSTAEVQTSLTADSSSSTKDTQAINVKLPEIIIPAIKTALTKLNSKWSSSAVIFSPASYYSCNINLPFNDEKTISKVLRSEIGDLLSFDAEDFIVDHKVVGKLNNGEFDIHLAMADKQELSDLINQCNACGFDPVAITPPTIVPEAGGLNQDSPTQQMTENSCCIQISADAVNISFQLSRQIRSDRKLSLNSISELEIIAEIKRSLLSVEKRYQTDFSSIYLLISDSQQTQSELTDNIEQCLIDSGRQVVRQNSNYTDAITTILASNRGAAGLFVNFRTGELAKVLSLSNIWQIFRPFVPYLLLSLLLVFMALSATYFNKESEIDGLEANINAKSAQILGLQSVATGTLSKTIQQSISTIEKQLSEIGSPSKYSPLEILVQLSKDFSAITLPKLTNLSIKSTELTFTISSDSFEAIDPVEKILNSNKKFYCSYERKDSGSGTREFNFTVKLCE